MKLSISNIAWDTKDDLIMYSYLKEKSFWGLEIAPTKWFPDNPYKHLQEAAEYARNLYEQYGLTISSMQSIWFGKNEKITGSIWERKALLDYTKRAILFAETIGCKNLVFGCPKNRNVSSKEEENLLLDFFTEIATFAYQHNTVFALEANPAIYGTNYMNYTNDAIIVCRKVGIPGIGVNYDLGTVIQNKENIEMCLENLDIVNHIHISEPYLEIIKHRELHKVLFKELKALNYNKFVSIEMKQQSLVDVLAIIDYLGELNK